MDLALNNLQRLICHKTHPTYLVKLVMFVVSFHFLRLSVSNKKELHKILLLKEKFKLGSAFTHLVILL